MAPLVQSSPLPAKPQPSLESRPPMAIYAALFRDGFPSARQVAAWSNASHDPVIVTIRCITRQLFVRFSPVGAAVSFYFGAPVECRDQRPRLRRRSQVRGEDLFTSDILSVHLVIAFVIIPEGCAL